MHNHLDLNPLDKLPGFSLEELSEAAAQAELSRGSILSKKASFIEALDKVGKLKRLEKIAEDGFWGVEETPQSALVTAFLTGPSKNSSLKYSLPAAAVSSALFAPEDRGLNRLASVLGGGLVGAMVFPRIAGHRPASSSARDILQYLFGNRTGAAIGAGAGHLVSMGLDPSPTDVYLDKLRSII